MKRTIKKSHSIIPACFISFCLMGLSSCTDQAPNDVDPSVIDTLNRIEAKLDHISNDLASKPSSTMPSADVTNPVLEPSPHADIEGSVENPLDKTTAIEYQGLCLSCHTPRGGGMDQRLAPPFFGVIGHYRQVYGNDEESMVKAMIKYIQAPSEEASLMPGARSRFNPMPPLPLPDEHLDRLVRYMLKDHR